MNIKHHTIYFRKISPFNAKIFLTKSRAFPMIMICEGRWDCGCSITDVICKKESKAYMKRLSNWSALILMEFLFFIGKKSCCLHLCPKPGAYLCENIWRRCGKRNAADASVSGRLLCTVYCQISDSPKRPAVRRYHKSLTILGNRSENLSPRGF